MCCRTVKKILELLEMELLSLKKTRIPKTKCYKYLSLILLVKK